MFPILLKFGGFSIHTFGLLLAVAVVVAIALARRELARKQISPAFAYDLAMYALIGGILGARLTYVVAHAKEFAAQPLSAFALWEGGLIFYGGLAGGALAVLLFVAVKRLPVWRIADVLAPGLAAGSAIGRIGCFSNGCCYGVPTKLPWGVIFTRADSAVDPHLLGIPLQPTQLYEFAYNIVILGVLWSLRKRISVDGLLFWMFLGLYGFFRFLVEFLRVKPIILMGLGGSQLFSLALMVVSLAVIGFKCARSGCIADNRYAGMRRLS